MTKTERTAYNCVRRGVAKTRAELSKVMDVSRPTASTLADSLINSGFLRDGGKWHSSGGRNPTLLLVCPEAFSLVGMDLGFRDRVSGALVDAAGNIVRGSDIMMSPDNPERAADAVTRLWERLDPDFSASGIGLAVPGTLDAATGTVSDCDLPGFGGNELFRLLRKRFVGKFVYAAPRLQLAAISEGFGGAADREADFMLLTLGKIPEAVFYINGRCFVGAHGSVGTLGDLPTISYDGSEWTTFGEALSADVLNRVHPTPEQLATVCANALRHVLSIVGIGLIVLAGRFRDFDDDFMPLLERRLSRFGCNVKMAVFGRFSTSRGAALQTHIGV